MMNGLRYCGTHVAHSHSSVRNIATSASSRHSATIPLTVFLLSSCLSFRCYRFTVFAGYLTFFQSIHCSGLLFLPFFLVAGFSYSILIHFSHFTPLSTLHLVQRSMSDTHPIYQISLTWHWSTRGCVIRALSPSVCRALGSNPGPL